MPKKPTHSNGGSTEGTRDTENRDLSSLDQKPVAFKSKAFEAIHSAASDLYQVGIIDKTAMQEFDATCLHTPQHN